MKYIFGPVPSRRLGQSLGIDTIPLKTCNWNCVYCQLGRTMPVTNERREYVQAEDILLEAEQFLRSRSKDEFDWVTFVGSGEPTLHNRIGWLIRKIKSLTNKPIAVITNGSLLYLPEVREELMIADAILPTLDAGTAKLYRQINRPHPDLMFEHLVNGLTTFRPAYHGKLWVEVMLVRGLNDSTQALEDLAGILEGIKPDAIHINLPTRPPAETWVQEADAEGLMRALSIWGNVAEVVHPAQGNFDLSGCKNIMDAVLAVITRHPMRQDELEEALIRWSPRRVRRVLADLQSSGRAKIVVRNNVHFWCASPSFYPNDTQSRRTIPSNHRQSIKSETSNG